MVYVLFLASIHLGIPLDIFLFYSISEIDDLLFIKSKSEKKQNNALYSGMATFFTKNYQIHVSFERKWYFNCPKVLDVWKEIELWIQDKGEHIKFDKQFCLEFLIVKEMKQPLLTSHH